MSDFAGNYRDQERAAEVRCCLPRKEIPVSDRGRCDKLCGLSGCEFRWKGNTYATLRSSLPNLLCLCCSIVTYDTNRAMQITVEDFWLLLLDKSPHLTVEEMEEDLNEHEAEVDASLPELKQQLTALLA